MIGIYTCKKCKHTFQNKPAPQICPQCKCIWIQWENYAELFGADRNDYRYSEEIAVTPQ